MKRILALYKPTDFNTSCNAKVNNRFTNNKQINYKIKYLNITLTFTAIDVFTENIFNGHKQHLD